MTTEPFDVDEDEPTYVQVGDDEFMVLPDGSRVPVSGPEADLLALTTEPVHICIPGSPDDPRSPRRLPPWVVATYVPELHPDDLWVVDGLPCTSPSRTLIDMGECVESEAELWQLFANAQAKGHLDRDALAAARSRVEWRPSLGMVDRVIATFFP